MSRSQQFLDDIETFLAVTGISATALGMRAVNDPAFVGDVRAGRSVSLGLVDKVYEFMKSERESAA
jgi:hypothetical protein